MGMLVTDCCQRYMDSRDDCDDVCYFKDKFLCNVCVLDEVVEEYSLSYGDAERLTEWIMWNNAPEGLTKLQVLSIIEIGGM